MSRVSPPIYVDIVEHFGLYFEILAIFFKIKKTCIEIPLRLTCRTAPHLYFDPIRDKNVKWNWGGGPLLMCSRCSSNSCLVDKFLV